MKTLAETIHGQSDAFAPTHWSVIIAAGESQADPQIAQTALAQLCQTYWAPLYGFVRSRGYSVHDAQDLTQSFFAYLIEKKIYNRADRQKGKFRSFLLASLKNFLADSRDREQALKRGGGRDFLPLDEDQAEEAESLFCRMAEEAMRQSKTTFLSAPGQRRLWPAASRGWRQITESRAKKNSSRT